VEHDLTILTPEKAIVTYRLAGLGSRISAHLVDLILVAVLTIGAILGFGYILGNIDAGLATALISVAVVFIPLLYFVLMEGLWNGQTLGKRSAGIRVRMADGTPVTLVAALTRNIMRPADMVPGAYFVGILAMFLNPRSQRLGDLIADTVVCYERRASAILRGAPHTAGVHPLESEVGDLRGMTIEEYNALRRLADRFPELTPEVQDRLLSEVWGPIAERRQVPSPSNVHPIYMVEASVMKYGRQHGIL